MWKNKERRWLLYLPLALILSAAAGYVDTVNDEVQAPLLLILVAAGLLGALDARRTWLWALIMGLSVAPAEAIVTVAGGRTPSLTALLPLIVMPVIFALVAALAGALARWAIDSARRTSPGDPP